MHIRAVQKHRKLVSKYLEKFALSKLGEELGFSYSDAEDLAYTHDKDKLENKELFDQYKYISYLYYCKKHDLECEIEYTKEMDDATQDHIINNKHHAEYWDKNYRPVEVTDFKNRDSTTINSVSGKNMPDESIIEMVCDWKAVGDSRNNKAIEWADKVKKNKRYVFTDDQWDFIYEILDVIDN